MRPIKGENIMDGIIDSLNKSAAKEKDNISLLQCMNELKDELETIKFFEINGLSKHNQTDLREYCINKFKRRIAQYFPEYNK